VLIPYRVTSVTDLPCAGDEISVALLDHCDTSDKPKWGFSPKTGYSEVISTDKRHRAEQLLSIAVHGNHQTCIAIDRTKFDETDPPQLQGHSIAPPSRFVLVEQ
jgi:hypothetical protein